MAYFKVSVTFNVEAESESEAFDKLENYLSIEMSDGEYDEIEDPEELIGFDEEDFEGKQLL